MSEEVIKVYDLPMCSGWMLLAGGYVKAMR
jgi:hypothetical protein